MKERERRTDRLKVNIIIGREKKRDRQIESEPNYRERQADRQTNLQADRQTCRQTDRYTNRLTDRQTVRETD